MLHDTHQSCSLIHPKTLVAYHRQWLTWQPQYLPSFPPGSVEEVVQTQGHWLIPTWYSYDTYLLRSTVFKSVRFFVNKPVCIYYIRNQQDATLAVSFISHCKIILHVSDVQGRLSLHIVQWQPTLNIVTGYVTSRPMTSCCYYSF